MNIMIVEDDRVSAHFFSEIARTAGYKNAVVADSAEAALEMAMENTYDLITLDVQLPGASGLEILSVIRNISPHAIIAIISGHLPGDIPPDTHDYADVVIKKPVSPDVFTSLLHSTARICEEMENIRSLENKDV